ncbi:cephalosporin hydroxylase family protein [Aeromonas enteropelogenes]|uniref:cephalosporin hydroxylase family protein n=1 Tax=Aeromonas enteropelogenes TaxID=29489 RepID=UPI003B9F001C
MNEYEKFINQCEGEVKRQRESIGFRGLTGKWMDESLSYNYSYHFSWMGRPIIQYPQDMIAMQELIWKIKPDLIIETGIAHGGSIIFSASMLAMLDMCDAIDQGKTLDPASSNRRVIGIDIDIRQHNREAIEAHPMSSRITMIQGSSVSDEVIAQVKSLAKGYTKVLVCLDSNHTHDHVLAELQAYAPLVSVDSYCVVFDTIIEHMPENMFPDRPWHPGNSPKTAVDEFLRQQQENPTKPQFNVDATIEHKLQITVAPGGFLQRTR